MNETKNSIVLNKLKHKNIDRYFVEYNYSTLLDFIQKLNCQLLGECCLKQGSLTLAITKRNYLEEYFKKKIL